MEEKKFSISVYRTCTSQIQHSWCRCLSSTIKYKEIHAFSIKSFILCYRTCIGPASLVYIKYILQDFADVLPALLLSSPDIALPAFGRFSAASNMD